MIEKIIRCIYEKPSEPGSEGATTMNITSLTVGTPRKWRVYVDIGQGNASTIVYPLYVKWTLKTFYRTRNVLITGKEGTFTGFVDGNNLWNAGHAAGRSKEGVTQQVRVTP